MAKLKALQLIPNLHRATHRVSVFVERDSRLGLNQAEAHVLAHLAVYGNSTVAQLHSAFGHRRSTLTSILDRLAARGFIARTSSPADRRTFIVSLTPAGKGMAARAYNALLSIEQEVLAAVRRADVNGFRAVARAISELKPAGLVKSRGEKL